jgi:phosphonate transport system substrate-binding protein
MKILLIIIASITISLAEHKITLGFMPYLSPSTIIEKYTPLVEYLERSLDVDVKIVVAEDYSSHIQNVIDDRVDLAFLGGMPYVKVTQKSKKPLLVRYEFNNEPTFESVLFTREDSNISSIEDIRGKRMAFGSKRSTLSSQVPTYMLEKSGIELDDLKSHSYIDNHENVVLGVEYGDFDVGAVAKEVFLEYSKMYNLKIIQTSQPLSTHVIVSSTKLDKKLRAKIQKLLLNANRDVLKPISPALTSFVKAKDSDYDKHREILKELEK